MATISAGLGFLVLVLIGLLAVGGIVVAIVFACRSGKKPPQQVPMQPNAGHVPVAQPQPVQPQPVQTQPTPVCNARIFVNGGREALATVIVDGRQLRLTADMLPVEIPVSAGVHHVQICGGLEGDARVDRQVSFENQTVLTVDLPGTGDADLIRFQIISFTEYRNAVNSCGFRVTTKRL